MQAEVEDYKTIQQWHDEMSAYYYRHVGFISSAMLDEYFASSWPERFVVWQEKEKLK